jgi:hypothetical protein
MPADDSLRWAEPEEVIRLAREAGFSDREIVRHLTGNLSHTNAQEVARTYAPLMGTPIREFMNLRKNE